MVDARELLKALCPDPRCAETFSGVYELFYWLEGVLEELPEPRLSGAGQPLASGVENREEVAEALRLRGVEDEALVDYAIARLVSRRYKGVPSRGRCPVCGQVPTLLVLREKPGISFSTPELRARCICGYEGEAGDFTCPNCGAAGRENFEVYIAPQGSLKVFECRSCGFRFAEVRGDALEERELQALHGALRLLLKLGGGEARGRGAAPGGTR
jgi:FdhE protein